MTRAIDVGLTFAGREVTGFADGRLTIIENKEGSITGYVFGKEMKVEKEGEPMEEETFTIYHAMRSLDAVFGGYAAGRPAVLAIEEFHAWYLRRIARFNEPLGSRLLIKALEGEGLDTLAPLQEWLGARVVTLINERHEKREEDRRDREEERALRKEQDNE